MILIVQLILYCILFTGMVAFAVRGGAIDGLYFYPKPVQERAFEIGLTDRETMKTKKKRFMTLFYVVMFLALVLIIGFWNGIRDFKWHIYSHFFFLK